MQQIICAHAVIGITVTYTRVRLLKSAYLGGGGGSPGVEGSNKLPLMERIFKSIARGLLSRITASFKRRNFWLHVFADFGK